jgi:hypothetical protein
MEEETAVGPAGGWVVLFEFELQTGRLAPLSRHVDVGNGDLPGEDAWWVVLGGRLLDAEVDRVRPEGYEVGILLALVDHRQTELLVEDALSGKIGDVQDGCQAGEQLICGHGEQSRAPEGKR